MAIKKTKIIATLGPASLTAARLHEMYDAGLDVCRLNFSHGTKEQHAEAVALVRRVASERHEPATIIGDLQGPKIRLTQVGGGTPDDSFELTLGQEVELVEGDARSTEERLCLATDNVLADIDVGNRIYIDDGLVRLLVIDRTPDGLRCGCTTGGTISSRKGVNLPDTQLKLPALTEKDRVDLDWAIEHELAYVALSFVRRPEDLYELRRLVKARGADTQVIIKIEKTEALDHLPELIEQSDAVLVARGDLGVEIDVWRVPLVQKDIVARARRAGVPVIVATQMMQSMVSSPMPTRAEVSDVANAIFDRADAVMLSAESAVGRYPGLAVDMMARVAQHTEAYLAAFEPANVEAQAEARFRPTLAIAHAAVQAALKLDAKLVAAWSASGSTIRTLSRYRLPMPVVAFTFDELVQRRLRLLYGVTAIRVAPLEDLAEMAGRIDELLLSGGLASKDDLIVVVLSTDPETAGATDTTLVHRVGRRGGQVIW